MKHPVTSCLLCRAALVYPWFAVLFMLVVVPARADVGVFYPESYYQNQRCLPPCACALGPIEGRVFGDYSLRLISIGDVFDFYAVDNVNFVVRSPGGLVALSGSGTYQRSDIIGQQLMHLDLSPGNGVAPIPFDSGMVQMDLPLPLLRLELTNSTTPCEHFLLRFVGGPQVDCTIDFDNGSGLGVPDNAVDVSDLLYFLVKFEAGDLAVDLAGGPCACVDCFCPDGAVDVQDLLYFLQHFERGC